MYFPTVISLILTIATSSIALPDQLLDARAGFYCPKANAFPNNRSCTATCFYDRPGGDYARHKTNSDQTCFDLCGLDPQCVTAQYKKSTGFCYFKHSLHKFVSDGNIDTVDCSVVSGSPASTSTSTDGGTATSTSSSTPTPTVAPAAVSCDNNQTAYCLQDPNRCLCALKTDFQTATCYSTLDCDNPCTSDADCRRDGFRCAYDNNDNCRRGVPSRTCVGSVRDTHCNANPPVRSIKRDLEEVFEAATRGVVL